jgi:hypothetical protein
MSTQLGAITTGVLLGFIGYVSPAVARGGFNSPDPPWNSEHISQLPEEVRKALIQLCGESALAAHYFATYAENSRLIKLHFEHLHCGNQKPFCTQAGCLHQVYRLNGARYRLLRSFYGPGDD